MTFPPSLFDRLPLFATDDEIAIAIVGRKRASEWKRGALRLLDAKGFPRVDALHGGRPVPLVRKWYNQYLGIEKSYIQAPAVAEDSDVWTRSKRERRDDRKPKLNLDYRGQKTLLYMVARPDAKTHAAIPDAGAFTMDKLAEKGAITAQGTDRDGDTVWLVTDLGMDEAKRINLWHYGKSAS
ncbi:hypothetical protein [Rhizobium indicum]|uniref:Uncharacterized protein n=1 Tax=Rhizobium indicum TaxID=2583231 RepID=A0ABX6PI44_9HYPH|nr:hypothetical protein [Rhizobium indicum]QKK18678.1 hypothetical protein FFM53_020435 [Rhizobium indicum]